MIILLRLFLFVLGFGRDLVKRAGEAQQRKAGWNEATIAAFRAYMDTQDKADEVDRALLLDDDLNSEWLSRVRARAAADDRDNDPDPV